MNRGRKREREREREREGEKEGEREREREGGGESWVGIMTVSLPRIRVQSRDFFFPEYLLQRFGVAVQTLMKSTFPTTCLIVSISSHR